MLIVVRANMFLLWDRLFDKLEYQNMERQLLAKLACAWVAENGILRGGNKGPLGISPDPPSGKPVPVSNRAKYDIGVG